MNYIVNNLDTI